MARIWYGRKTTYFYDSSLKVTWRIENTTRMGIYMIYFDSTEGATALLPANVAALAEFQLSGHISLLLLLLHH